MTSSAAAGARGVRRSRRGPGWASVAACVVALGACAQGSTRPARGPAAPGDGALERALAAPCVPRGIEECGNARDDDCNGVIDEGCGQRSGLVQFVIAWTASNADVDLLVTDPRGELVEVGRPSAAGLVKDRDCPGRKQECHGRNVENVYLVRDEPRPGRYRVRIRLERLNDEDTPIRVTFGARVGQRTYAADLDLERPEAQKELFFAL